MVRLHVIKKSSKLSRFRVPATAFFFERLYMSNNRSYKEYLVFDVSSALFSFALVAHCLQYSVFITSAFRYRVLRSTSIPCKVNSRVKPLQQINEEINVVIDELRRSTNRKFFQQFHYRAINSPKTNNWLNEYYKRFRNYRTRSNQIRSNFY